MPANYELSPPGFTFPAHMASIPRVLGVPIGAESERWQGVAREGSRKTISGLPGDFV